MAQKEKPVELTEENEIHAVNIFLKKNIVLKLTAASITVPLYDPLSKKLFFHKLSPWTSGSDGISILRFFIYKLGRLGL